MNTSDLYTFQATLQKRKIFRRHELRRYKVDVDIDDVSFDITSISIDDENLSMHRSTLGRARELLALRHFNNISQLNTSSSTLQENESVAINVRSNDSSMISTMSKDVLPIVEREKSHENDIERIASGNLEDFYELESDPQVSMTHEVERNMFHSIHQQTAVETRLKQFKSKLAESRKQLEEIL